MNSSVLSQIGESINQLSLDEQLWLIEQLAHRIREVTVQGGESSAGRVGAK